MKISAQLLEVLWNNAGDTIPGGGKFTDKFVGPNKVIREGVFDIDGDEEFEGLEYKATITLGRLVPKKAQPVLVRSTKGKKAAA